MEVNLDIPITFVELSEGGFKAMLFNDHTGKGDTLEEALENLFEVMEAKNAIDDVVGNNCFGKLPGCEITKTQIPVNIKTSQICLTDETHKKVMLSSISENKDFKTFVEKYPFYK